MEIYHVYNKERFNSHQIKKIDLYYFISLFLFYIWLIAGIFIGNTTLFLIAVSFSLLRIPLYFINRKWSIVWSNLLPSINIVMMLIIFFSYLFKG
jgi:predicted neutral ceramidase superfamily lipid hydrolase